MTIMAEPTTHGYAPSDSIDAEVDLYDSEVIAVRGVIEALNQTRHTKATSVEGWRREIVQRFEDIGLKVRVVLHEIEEVEVGTGVTPGQILTSITIVGRLDEMKVGEFDHDRQKHEVRSNILGVDQPEATGTAPISIPTSSGEKRTSSGLILP